jgi:Spy/CpxP family protein refolding chaperone
MKFTAKHRLATALSLALAAGLPAAALAQTAAPSMAAPAATAPAMPAAMSAKVEQHIKGLHDQLKITPAEQPQWDQFASVMRDNAAQMEQALDERGTAAPTMNAMDNMQSYAKLAQVHATNMQKLASSFQALYAVFPDSQKQLADKVFQENNGKTSKKH